MGPVRIALSIEKLSKHLVVSFSLVTGDKTKGS